MSEDAVETQSDVQSAETPSASEAPASSEQVAPEASLGASQPTEEQYVPYSRFKEVIEQRKAFESQVEEMKRSYEQRFSELNNKLKQPEPAKPVNAFVEDLRKINPKYAETIENLEKQAAKADTLERQWNEYQAIQLRQNLVSKVTGLYETNKVPEKLRNVYGSAIENMIRVNNPSSLDAVDGYFKQVHSLFSDAIEEIKRQDRASYVQQKKNDTTPATQTGGAPAAKGKSEGPKTRQDVVNQIAAELRAAKQQI